MHQVDGRESASCKEILKSALTYSASAKLITPVPSAATLRPGLSEAVPSSPGAQVNPIKSRHRQQHIHQPTRSTTSTNHHIGDTRE
jgi:hypothetical protein